MITDVKYVTVNRRRLFEHYTDYKKLEFFQEN
jgi:hypothetical protein